ncbi:MAG: nuclear transport factor 2 family protein [Myxococcaceae bacterium]|nr:nuclear transport factor 2 family protein [Myxococcaceae bacterium]
METPKLKSELLSLERQYWQALKDRDIQGAVALTDDPCIVTGSQGLGSIDRETFVTMMQNSSYTLNDFSLSDDAKVLQLSDEVAILAYKVHEDLTVEGEHITLDAADASTWVKRDGNWVCALHTESITGDPFGRDRQPMSNGHAKEKKPGGDAEGAASKKKSRAK